MKEIDAQRVGRNFVGQDGEIPAGNGEVVDLLERCLMWADIVLDRLVPERYYFSDMFNNSTEKECSLKHFLQNTRPW